MKIVQFENPSDRRPRVGILADRGALDFSAAYQAYRRQMNGVEEPLVVDTMALLAGGLFARDIFIKEAEFAQKQGLTQQLTVSQPRLRAPVARPGKIVALGLNYASHAREGGKEPPDHPIIFQKASTAIIGPEDPVIIRRWYTHVDPEIELAVVIGRLARDVRAEDAWPHVAGYTIINDITERDMQAADQAISHPWFRSKSLDTFCPMGPWIVLPDQVGNPGALDLELRVNGQVRQKANTRDLVFGIPQLIEFISRHMTLEPGDIISTGTPAGIAPIAPGDIVECEIEGIGILRNPVRAEA